MSKSAPAELGWSAEACERGAAAVVDLDAIAHNVRVMRAAAPSAGLMAVVKADAYGHGLVPCAQAAQQAGAAWLATALLSEALALRAAGLEGRVLALICPPGSDLAAAVRTEVDVTVCTLAGLAAAQAAALVAGAPARVQLEVDTGLSRGGAVAADWAELFAAAARAEAAGTVRVTGVWSHFACADEPGHPANRLTLTRYAEALRQAKAAGLAPEVRHVANSAATLTIPEAHYDLVRPGIALYGLSPSAAVGAAQDLGLRAAMTLTARLAQVKNVAAGEGVSYGHDYHTPADTVLGLVPLGYGDGVLRSGSMSGPVHVAGRTCAVAGRVCMDQLVVDLGPGSTARAGDPVVLFGDARRGEPTADEWAAAAGTIGYEITTALSTRVPRVHVRSGG